VQTPHDLRYAENHEWARSESDGTVRVGITDYAQDALGDIVYVDLPEVGRKLAAGEAFAEVESTKSVSDIYAPVAGSIEAANEALAETPELVNSDPYGEGWMVVIRPEEGSTTEGLMDATAYTEYTAE
jgi:glycine cleavage system H protein